MVSHHTQPKVKRVVYRKGELLIYMQESKGGGRESTVPQPVNQICVYEETGAPLGEIFYKSKSR